MPRARPGSRPSRGRRAAGSRRRGSRRWHRTGTRAHPAPARLRTGNCAARPMAMLAVEARGTEARVGLATPRQRVSATGRGPVWTRAAHQCARYGPVSRHGSRRPPAAVADEQVIRHDHQPPPDRRHRGRHLQVASGRSQHQARPRQRGRRQRSTRRLRWGSEAPLPNASPARGSLSAHHSQSSNGPHWKRPSGTSKATPWWWSSTWRHRTP